MSKSEGDIDKEICSKCLDYGVELFKYHADQRLRCIRYYTVVILALVAGISKLILDEEMSSPSLVYVGFGIAGAITLFFWLLDIRNRALTEYAEDGLNEAEKGFFKGQKMRIITNGEEKKSKMTWQYGAIIPAFFVSIMLSLFSGVFLVFTDIEFDSIRYLVFCFVLIFLGVGLYAEVRFEDGMEEKDK